MTAMRPQLHRNSLVQIGRFRLGTLVVLTGALASAAFAGRDAWTAISFPATERVSAIAVDPVDPDTLIVAAGSTVYRTANGGASWENVPFCAVQDLQPLASETGTVFWASCAVDLDNLAVPSTDGRLYESLDSGATWVLIRATPFLGITKIDAGSSALAIIDQEVIPYHVSPFFSASLATGGNPNWRESPIGDVQVTGLKITPGDMPVAVVSYFYYPSTDFPATPPPQGGVLRSGDGGQTWQPGSGLPNDYAGPLALDPVDPAHLLVASNDRLYESGDRGSRWSPTGPVFPSRISALLFDPEGGDIFLGTLKAGVYRSDDGGSTWSSWSAGLSDPEVSSLAGGAGRIYAGTASGRLFRAGRIAVTPVSSPAPVSVRPKR